MSNSNPDLMKITPKVEPSAHPLNRLAWFRAEGPQKFSGGPLPAGHIRLR